jgi:hypothetical protein
VYDGTFTDGNFVQGTVKIRYENGEFYEGQCKKDKFDGIGKLLKPNGDM